MKADESKILFKPELPEELSDIYFLKLSLTDKAGKEISSNFYWLSAKGDDSADFKGLSQLPSVEIKVTPGQITKENGKLKLAVEFSNPSSAIAFGLNPKLLSISTKEPILPIFWQDNYFALMPGEKRTIEMHVDASQVTEKNVLFRLDGWNIRAVQDQELDVH
jgi:exo-1,4-beta-D-glucosaminidase